MADTIRVHPSEVQRAEDSQDQLVVDPSEVQGVLPPPTPLSPTEKLVSRLPFGQDLVNAIRGLGPMQVSRAFGADVAPATLQQQADINAAKTALETQPQRARQFITRAATPVAETVGITSDALRALAFDPEAVNRLTERGEAMIEAARPYARVAADVYSGLGPSRISGTPTTTEQVASQAANARLEQELAQRKLLDMVPAIGPAAHALITSAENKAPAETAGDFLNLGLRMGLLFSPEWAPAVLGSTARYLGAAAERGEVLPEAINGFLSGGWQRSTEKVPFGYRGLSVDLPAWAAGALKYGGVGKGLGLIGVPGARTAGGIMGATYGATAPFIRGGIQGVREALAEARAARAAEAAAAGGPEAAAGAGAEAGAPAGPIPLGQEPPPLETNEEKLARELAEKRPPPTPPIREDMELLNGISEKIANKPFGKLDPEKDKAAIAQSLTIYDRIKGAPQAEVVSPEAAQAAAERQTRIQAKLQELEQRHREQEAAEAQAAQAPQTQPTGVAEEVQQPPGELQWTPWGPALTQAAETGKAQAAQAIAETAAAPEGAAPAPAAGAKLTPAEIMENLRVQLGAGTPEEQAAQRATAAAEEAAKGERIEAAVRGDKVEKFANFFTKRGNTPEEVEAGDPDFWSTAFTAEGAPRTQKGNPYTQMSQESRGQVVERMRELQPTAAAPTAAAAAPAAAAGPARQFADYLTANKFSSADVAGLLENDRFWNDLVVSHKAPLTPEGAPYTHIDPQTRTDIFNLMRGQEGAPAIADPATLQDFAQFLHARGEKSAAIKEMSPEGWQHFSQRFGMPAISPEEGSYIAGEMERLEKARPAEAKIGEAAPGMAETEAPEPGSEGKLRDILTDPDAVAQAAIERMRKRGTFSGTKLGAGVDPADIGDMAVWGGAKLVKGAQRIFQGVTEFPEWSREMVGEFGSAIIPYLERMWVESKAIADSASKDVKRRSIEDLHTRIPDEMRVASPDPTRTVAGADFHSLPLDTPGNGFLALAKLGPLKANNLINRFFSEAVAESEAAGGTTAADAVKETGMKPPNAQFWDAALRQPIRSRYWYELGAEAMTGKYLDIPREMQPWAINALAGTSGGAEPLVNLRRAIGSISEDLQQQPIMTDLRDPTSVRNALNPEATGLKTPKYRSFSGTMQYTGGLSNEPPLPVNDVQVASMFGIPGEALGKNPILHEVFSRFFLKMRDAQNALETAGAQPWEAYQVQAPGWTYERALKRPGKAYNDYSQEFPKVIQQLQDAGIPTPGGKITLETLMDPRTPNVMSSTRAHFMGTPVATVEAATKFTPEGAAAADMRAQLEQLDPNLKWVQEAKDDHEQIQRNIMRGLGQRPEKQPSLISKLMSAVVGRKIDVSRIDTTAYGTFTPEGATAAEINANVRIPMTGSYSAGGKTQWLSLDKDQREAFLAIIGQDLNQEGSAASHFHAVDPTVPADTHSVFVQRYDGVVPQADIEKFSNQVGFPVNVAQRANGFEVNINIGGMENKPRPSSEAVRNLATETFGDDPNVRSIAVTRDQYAGDYVHYTDYERKINEFDQRRKAEAASRGATGGRKGVGGAYGLEGSAGDLAGIREAIRNLARQRDAAYAKWAQETGEKLRQHLAGQSPP